MEWLAWGDQTCILFPYDVSIPSVESRQMQLMCSCFQSWRYASTFTCKAAFLAAAGVGVLGQREEINVVQFMIGSL